MRKSKHKYLYPNTAHKVHILLTILEKVAQYHSIELTILKYLNNIHLREFIENYDNAWDNIAEFFEDSIILRGIIKLLKHSEKNMEHIVDLCRNLLVIAETEIKLRDKKKELIRKFTTKIIIMTLILGFSMGILLAIFSYTPIISALGHNPSAIDYAMLTLTVLASVFISLYKANIYTTLFTIDSSSPIPIKRLVSILLISLVLSFLLAFSLLH